LTNLKVPIMGDCSERFDVTGSRREQPRRKIGSKNGGSRRRN